jgi:hypothetical protein
MCNQPKLIYSPMYQINVDLVDKHCTSAKNYEFGKKLKFVMGAGGYVSRHIRGSKTLYLHRIIADACVSDPRRDLFYMVDHIDGNTKNNRVNNLRWVNNHLNMCNRRTQDGKTPPGVRIMKRKSNTGKWYASIYFTKNGCVLKSFRTLEKAVAFADDFNQRYFDRLYAAYLNSPQDAFERRLYWAKNTLSISDFRHNQRVGRREVLSGNKFLVVDALFKKLTMKDAQNGEAPRGIGGQHASGVEQPVSD